MGALAQLLGLERPCPGWTRRWGFTWNCKLPFGHRGDHRNGNRTWKPGE